MTLSKHIKKPNNYARINRPAVRTLCVVLAACMLLGFASRMSWAAPVDVAVDELLATSNTALQAKDYARAISLAQRAQRIAPRDPRPWRQLADIYEQEGKLELAAMLRERANAMDPHSAASDVTVLRDDVEPNPVPWQMVEPTPSHAANTDTPPNYDTRHARETSPSNDVPADSVAKLTTIKRLSAMPVLQSVDAIFAARTRSHVRSGPGIGFDSITLLDKNERVYVAGRVRDTNWVLVTRGGAAVGFVYFPLLVPSNQSEAERAPNLKTGSVRTDPKQLRIAVESRRGRPVDEQPQARQTSQVTKSAATPSKVEDERCVDTSQAMIKPDGEIEHLTQRYCMVDGQWTAQR